MVPATITIDFNDGETFGGDEIKCSICLGILEKTWTVTACLHRFCSDCLHRSLRVQLGSQKIHHECPLCRAKLASRRSSKPDPKFDTLIGNLHRYVNIHVYIHIYRWKDKKIYSYMNINIYVCRDVCMCIYI
jgi:hypothetical protein